MLASERSRPASGLKDLEAVQRLAGSPVLFAVFDMPWAPFFIFAIYSFHPLLGHLAVAGMLLLIGATLLNQYLTSRPEAEANAAAMQGDAFAETIRQQGEMVQALGMQRRGPRPLAEAARPARSTRRSPRATGSASSRR